MASNGKLFGMGNPLLDISSNVEQAVLDKYGVKAGDIILAEEKHQPVYGELAAMDGVEYFAGGATQNSIRVAQWMHGVEGSTTYTGAVGKDAYAQQLRDAAAKDGVAVPYYEVEDGTATGTCAVLVKEHERALIANLSAANKFDVSHLDKPEVWAAVEAAAVYYCAGFFLTVSPDAMEKVGKHASENNKLFCMNVSAPFLCAVFKDQMMTVMPYVDILFGNEDEARAFSEAAGWDTQDTTKIATKMAELPKVNGARKRTVVITHGAGATVVVDDKGDVTTTPIIAIEDSQIVDVNGAGDAFVGGFLAQLMKGRPLQESVDAGMYAAWVIIQQSGCRFPTKCEKTDFAK